MIRRSSEGWRAAAWLLLYFAVGSGLAALAGVWLVAAASGTDAAWAVALLRRGPGKVSVRLMQAMALVLLPVLLRALRWRGWGDTGWRPAGPAPARRAAAGFAWGWWIGIASLGLCAAALMAAGRRAVQPDPGAAMKLARLLLSVLIIGVFEETLARGILFRTLSRAWTAGGAAWLTSLMFAFVHFLEPPPAAFEVSCAAARVLAVWRESAFPFARMAATDALRMANLTLMGLVLCALLARSGHLWVCIGLHAGWVWAIKAMDRLTDPVPVPASVFWGQRSDLTDSLLGASVLAALLASLILHGKSRLKNSGGSGTVRGSNPCARAHGLRGRSSIG